MHRPLRIMLGGAALAALAACAHETGSPTATPDDTDLLTATAIDPSLGAEAGQASLPGLTLDRTSTYQGSLAGSDQCTYSAPLGRLVCPPVTRNGLTIARSIAFYDADGTPQSHRDLTTRSVNTQVAVKGTVTTERATLAIDRASSLTVSGLGRGATTHTLNGEETGTSDGTFTAAAGTLTWHESFTVATKNVVVPAEVRNGWPLSGTTTRTATTTLTRGAATRTSTSSEQVTYTGTSVVNVTITRDGVTRTCTRDLATRPGSCS